MMSWNSIFFHSPSTYLMELIILMHDYLMMFLCSIILLVFFNMANLLYSKFFSLGFFENHQLETLWTVAPFFILLFILVPSLKALYILDTCLFCGVTLSIMGHQWYWSYFYKDFLSLFYDSYMIPNSFMRLLEVDNSIVLPSSFPIRFLVSSADVIHSWTIPSFGIKMDAVPGRLNQFCTIINHTGIFFGQCSEICGANHSFMPVVLESVSFKDYLKLFYN